MSRPEEFKRLLTIEEVKQKLSLGKTKVFQLIATGELKSVQIGKARRIPITALEEFVDGLWQVTGDSNTAPELKESKENRGGSNERKA